MAEDATAARLPGTRAIPVRAGAAAALALLTFAVHGALVAFDTAPQAWDPAHHLLQMQRFARDLEADGIGAVAARWRAYHLYPPGGYLPGAVAIALTGPSIAWARHLQAVPLAATVLLLYAGLARSGAARPALWAAAYLGVPLALALARVTYPENLLALGVVALALRLATSPALATGRERLAAGALLGAGLLVKWSFALFGAALLAGWLFEARRDRALAGERLRGALVAALVALPIAATWYLPHFGATLDDLFLHAYEKTLDSPALFSLASLVRYPVELLVALGAPLFALFAFALVAPALRSSAAGARTRFLVVAVLAGLALLTLAGHKQGRFLQPLLPLVVWIAGARIGAGAIAPLASGVVPAALVALNVFLQATPGGCGRPVFRAPLPLSFPGSIFPVGAPELGLGAIQRCDWGLDELTAILGQPAAARGGGVLLRALEDHPYLNRKTLTTQVLAARRWSAPGVSAAGFVVSAIPAGAPRPAMPPPTAGFATFREWLLPDGALLRLELREAAEAARPAGSEVADAP